VAETARDENSVRGAYFMPCYVEGGWVVNLSLVFEIGGIDPNEVEFLAAAHGAVLEGFDDGEVAVVEGGVFSYQDYGDGVEETFLLGCEFVPFCPSTLAAVDERLRLGDVVELEDVPDCGYEALFFEEKRDMVCGGDIVDGNDLLWLDLAEHGNFVDGALFERNITSASNLTKSARLPV